MMTSERMNELQTHYALAWMSVIGGCRRPMYFARLQTVVVATEVHSTERCAISYSSPS